MEWLPFVLPLWILLCIGAGFLAKSRGHEPFGFALLALLISPFIACIVLLVMPVNTRALDRINVATGSSRKCPFCAETVKAEAIVCRYCDRDIPPIRNHHGMVPMFTHVQIRQNTKTLIRELESQKRLAWVAEFLPMLGELHEMSQLPAVDSERLESLVSRIDSHLRTHRLLGLGRVLDWVQSLRSVEKTIPVI
jgi:hypothetical protein